MEFEDRTFAIVATKAISAEGVMLSDGDKVACITSPISVATLLGLIQFHNFRVEEVTAEQELDDSVDDVADEVAPTEEQQAIAEVEQSEPSSLADVESQPGEETLEPAGIDPELVMKAIQQFINDGLDEKTAKALAEENDLTPDGLKALIAEGYDLTELESIGQVRAEKILAVYKPAE